MKSSSQRLLVAAALMLLSIGFWWVGSRQGQGPATSTDQEVEVSAVPPLPTPAPLLGPPRPSIAASGIVKLEEPPQKQDKFADREVIAQKETVTELNGIKQVKRARLVRDASFKYPLIRVEDELVRGPNGDRLTRQVAMVGDHVLVKPVNPKMNESDLLDLLKTEGASIRRKMPASGNWLVAFAKPTLDTVPDMVALISRMKSLIQYAEPDFIMSANLLPNDASFDTLWGMHNTGQSAGVADADIDAPEAWELSTGSKTVKVGIIDSGVDLTHPDLLANLWTNPNEIPGNGLDDDHNGYVDDVRGWDFANNDASPQDDHGHGTHTSGTVGAVGNNGNGVAGVCWNVSLIGLKFLDSTGNGALSDAVEAISYATTLGVSVTSNSWSGGDYSQMMKDAIDAAGSAGILFVAAAGNDAENTDSSPAYPSSYSSSNLISVTATTRQEGLADFSNYGATSTDLGAPGLDIYSSTLGGGFGYNSGTSMACPHVAGACALLKSFRPSLTHLNIRDLILETVDVIPSLSGKTVTGGRLNLYNALLASGDILVTPGFGLTASGPLGGPYTPTSKVYTVKNYTQQNASWTATLDHPWASLSSSGGTLSAGESITFTVTLNEAALDLPAGNQTTTLTVTSTMSGRIQLRPITIVVNPLPVIVQNLDADPGWTRTGEWAFGVPQGLGGKAYGLADPRSGFTGSHVFGINLAGDYSTVIGEAQYLTAGPFDVSRYRNTQLKFQRWLNSDYQPWVHATVEISNDNVSWHPLWNNGDQAYAASEWTQVEYDISPYADNQSQVYIRWGHQVGSLGAYAYSGWNVDDVQIVGVPGYQVTLTLPSSVTEGGAPGQANVAIAPILTSDLTITLTSNRPGQELSLPASVIVPSGADEITFPVSAIQDALADGSQKITVTATAPDYPDSVASILVHDDEQAQLQLLLPASLIEGAGEVLNQATISLVDPAQADILVRLQSSDLTELLVPPTITIPQGQIGVFFPLNVPDDVIIDGTQNVTVTASVTNWPQAQRSLNITDNETKNLVINLPEKRLESTGLLPDEGSVSVGGILAAPLTVTLVSENPATLVVPESVVIVAGSSSATFDLHPQDDGIKGGDRSVRITASSAGFSSASTPMVVADDESPALPSQPIPTNQQTAVHPKSSLAWEYDPHSGAIPESYQVYLKMAGGTEEFLGSTTLPTWSLTLPQLTAGTTYQWRIVSQIGSDTRSGPVWTFTTATAGPLHHYVWDSTPSTAALNVPFPVRVTAVDANEIPLSNYSKRTHFKAQIQQPETRTGTGNYPWIYPLGANYHDVRSQSIYTPAEVGGAGRLTALALDISSVPGQILTHFTIRLRHTTKTDYVNGGFTWESENWTTVYTADQTISTTGWLWFNFTTPFDYDGTSNLMVDFSFNNTDYTTNGSSRTSIISNYRTLAYRTDSAFGDPLTWSGSVPNSDAYNGLPNLRLQRATYELPLSPELSAPYRQGSWSGQITLLDIGQGLQLKAIDEQDPNISGLSNLMDVVVVDDFTLASEPPFTGGTSNSLSGAALSSGYEYEIQRATQLDFNDAASSGYLSEPNHLFASLSDGQLYHYRARAIKEGVAGQWSAVERSTQDASPPVITFTRPTGGITALSSMDLDGIASDVTSGVSSLIINDVGSASTDVFTTPLNLNEGLNTLTLTATDNAVPPNVQNVTWTVFRIADLELDVNANGLPTLLEYAFNAEGSTPSAMLPSISAAKNPDTNQTHLILSYRRLINNPSNLTYTVETSTDLDDWESAETTSEVLSATATGDGMTELVQVRINPSIEGQERRFARVSVRTLTP